MRRTEGGSQEVLGRGLARRSRDADDRSAARESGTRTTARPSGTSSGGRVTIAIVAPRFQASPTKSLPSRLPCNAMKQPPAARRRVSIA
jgi:hypothetical protein